MSLYIGFIILFVKTASECIMDLSGSVFIDVLFIRGPKSMRTSAVGDTVCSPFHVLGISVIADKTERKNVNYFDQCFFLLETWSSRLQVFLLIEICDV